MGDILGLAFVWLGLALFATLLAIWLRIATAMSEIIVGTVAQLLIGALVGGAALGTDQSWIRFLASAGAILLTFLAGAELDMDVLRSRWKETTTAFDFALDLARCTGSELRVLAVVRPPDFAEDVETEDSIERGRENMQKAMEEPLAKAASVGVTCGMDVVVGHPAEQIVIYAEANRIDHIVVGHRGHTFFERWLIGSVARQVIAYAPCAVTVVRPATTTRSR